MAFRRSFLVGNALWIITLLLLFPTGCGRCPLFRPHGKTLVIRLAPKVKMRLIYVAPLKIFVGKYEVSNQEYRCFRPDHSSGAHESMSLDGDNQPVVNVSWNDARSFCEWLTRNFGTSADGKLHFRLPTEKEWEVYAACGVNSEFPWGEWPPPKYLNYYGRENRGPNQKLENYDGYCVSCPVNKSGENEWGLFGVGGNVWEWCQDTDDPQEATHVLKGGSWADCAPLFLRTSRRSAYAAGYKYVNLGFRVVAEMAAISETPSDQTNTPPARRNESAGE